LIFGAVAHFVTAFKGGGTKQVIGQMLIGLVYLIGGIYFLTPVFMAIGTLIQFHWPSSSLWAIGTLVGINLLMTGISRLMFGLSAKTGDPSGGVRQLSVLSCTLSVSGPGFGILGRRSVPSRGLEIQKR